MYAGRECARALAKDSLEVKDCINVLCDCTEEELQRLEQQLAHIRDVYDEVGKVRELAEQQGSAATSKPKNDAKLPLPANSGFITCKEHPTLQLPMLSHFSSTCGQDWTAPPRTCINE